MVFGVSYKFWCCVFIYFKIYFILRFPLVLFLNLFLIGEKLLYNVLFISAVEQCEPAITIHISSATWASFPSSHHTALGNHRVPSRTPVLYRNFSPAIYFTHDVYICIYMSMLLPHSSHALHPPLCPQVHTLQLHLHSFPANRFISTIFLDSICMC